MLQLSPAVRVSFPMSKRDGVYQSVSSLMVKISVYAPAFNCSSSCLSLCQEVETDCRKRVTYRVCASPTVRVTSHVSMRGDVYQMYSLFFFLFFSIHLYSEPL